MSAQPITIGAIVRTGSIRITSSGIRPEDGIKYDNCNRVGKVIEMVRENVVWRIEFPDGATDTFTTWDLEVLENL